MTMEAHKRLSNHCKMSDSLNFLYLMHAMVPSGEVNLANKNVFIELWAND